MKFIQLNQGTSVRKSDVVAVERLEKGGSRVVTTNASYDCPFLYESILQLLEWEEIEERVEEKSNKNLWGAQHFAG
jgi:hypothetical protein